MRYVKRQREQLEVEYKKESICGLWIVWDSNWSLWTLKSSLGMMGRGRVEKRERVNYN